MASRKENGGHSTKAVRPDDKRLMSKTELQDAHLQLTPYCKKAIQVHAQAIEMGERWAVELFYKYYFRLPTQTIDQKLEVTNFDINSLYDQEAPEALE